MAGTATASGAPSREPTGPVPPRDETLPRWLLVSLIVHGVLILGLFLSPLWPSRPREPLPSYVVDLVGGERIGGRNLGTRLRAESKAKPRMRPPEPPQEPKAIKTVAPPEPVKKVETKPEPLPKKEKPEKAKVKPREAIVTAKATVPPQREVQKEERKKETTKQKTVVKEANDSAASQDNSLDRVRERLIQSAIERVRSRTSAAQGTSGALSKDSGEPLSAGAGEGMGAQSLGAGGVGGEGVLKSIEYLRYFNNMEATLKANWAWAGARRDLKALVRFGIRESGEIVAIKIVESSGDSRYDESVIRAVRKSSPLPAPPEKYRSEFSDVQFYFQPDQAG